MSVVHIVPNVCVEGVHRKWHNVIIVAVNVVGSLKNTSRYIPVDIKVVIKAFIIFVS